MYEILDPSLNIPRTGPDPRRIQLPLDITSSIISHIRSPSDLSRIARTSRIHHFLTIPLLYHTVALRRPSRRPGGASRKRMALGALMKPGIAACVKVLEIVVDEVGEARDEEEWWGQGQWSDDETAWAVAVAGVVAGMTRLDVFLWNIGGYIHPLLYTALSRHPTLKSLRVSHPPIGTVHSTSLTSAPSPAELFHSLYKPNRPPIITIPTFRTLRRLDLHNLPGVSSLTDDYIPAIILSPSIEALSLSWRTPTPLGRMLSLQRLLRQPRPPPSRTENGFGGRQSRDGRTAGNTDGILRLKELALRNVIFDLPVGDIEMWIDMRRLEKLSLLDCDVIDPAAWLELITASGSSGENTNSPAAPIGNFGFPYSSPAASSTTGSTPGTHTASASTSASTSASMPRTIRPSLKSFRINSCASHWISLLNTFDGLEELYILDSPVAEATEAANWTGFFGAITQHHGATLKRLRLCSRWCLGKMDVSKLFRACPNIEELAFSMNQSQWDILDALMVFLAHVRFLHILDCSPLTDEEVMKELLTKEDTFETTLAKDELSRMEVFAFSDISYRGDQTAYWDEAGGQKLRGGRFVKRDEVREWAGIWRAEKMD